MVEKATLYNRVLVSCLYLVQGIFLATPGTTVLTYAQMPNYEILAYFAAAALPFSLKFISAPLVEKYTFPRYGRRKTWVVLSLLLAGALLLACTNFTAEDQQSQKYLAWCLAAVIFMVSLEDIGTDALAVKELRNPELTSFLQCVMQSIGVVIGSFVYLELVTGHLLSSIGLPALLTVPQYLSVLAVLTLLSALVIHFTYKQTTTKQQLSQEHSFFEVVLHYKYFVVPRYRLFRQGITFLLYYHGLHYFGSSYSVELIKQGHITKDLLNNLSNLSIVPVFALTSYLSRVWTDKQMIHRRTRYLMAARLCLSVLTFWASVTDPVWFCAIALTLQLLSNAQFFMNSMIANDFQESKFSAMYVTMMASLINFGNNTALHMKVISILGYEKASILGFVIMLVAIAGFGRVERWIKAGQKEQDMEAKVYVQVKQEERE